eukprot:1436262-Rhodomonas_salina.1
MRPLTANRRISPSLRPLSSHARHSLCCARARWPCHTACRSRAAPPRTACATARGCDSAELTLAAATAAAGVVVLLRALDGGGDDDDDDDDVIVVLRLALAWRRLAAARGGSSCMPTASRTSAKKHRNASRRETLAALSSSTLLLALLPPPPPPPPSPPSPPPPPAPPPSICIASAVHTRMLTTFSNSSLRSVTVSLLRSLPLLSPRRTRSISLRARRIRTEVWIVTAVQPLSVIAQHGTLKGGYYLHTVCVSACTLAPQTVPATPAGCPYPPTIRVSYVSTGHCIVETGYDLGQYRTALSRTGPGP